MHPHNCREENIESYLCPVEPVFQIVPVLVLAYRWISLSAVSWHVQRRVHVDSGVDG